MKVVLVRHGETDYNSKKIIQGHTDIPLNARGEAQARYAAGPLREKVAAFDAIYSSDLKRAVRTAELLTGKQPTQDAGIREKWMGDAEGRPVAEVYGWDRTKDPIMAWGESETELMARMHASYTRITAAHHQDDTILVVAHGACLRALIKSLTRSGEICAGEWENLVLRGHKPLANCCVIVIDNGKLVEFGTELVDAEYADPQLV